MVIRFLTKQQMVTRLQELAQSGWIKSLRPLNSGGIGNTIDSLLGLPENNLPISDTAQWELKTHRIGSSSLLTLFHMEPEPRNAKLVVNTLLPKYGWPDQSRANELSFRQTIQAAHPSDRGFGIKVDRAKDRVLVYFDPILVDQRHTAWLDTVRIRAGAGQLQPQPYWQFKDLFLKASTKLLKAFYVEAVAKRSEEAEYFNLVRVQVLQGFDLDKFVSAIESGAVLIDFDARSHHNHGTKFRLRQESIPNLYRYVDIVPLTPISHP
ncbi:MAG: MvaI/BcnI restriction endonuclease family protein [Candidatus Tectomicrobia bacterium]|uniref:MvaI/BcnI restriction endonuclease family protein n=1 Tax=Tectimicrobiota bacterium TaxID=2528274 RepID=A0A933LPB1_UNCTE|nr:MvaI/BcnI restriction endonuclease family protein [Candidatus Tectomicrobia bacterium]